MNSFDSIVVEHADSVCASGEAIVAATGQSCPEVGGEVWLLPLTRIVPDPNQPRKNKGDLERLKKSIQTHGLIHHIVVRPLEDGKYCIVTGERRYLAALELGWSEIAAIVLDIAPQKTFDLQRAENRDRKDFTPFEIGEAFWKMKTEKGMTQKEIGEEDGLSQSEVSEYMKLRSLPPHLKIDYDALPLEDNPFTKSLLFEIARMTPGEEQNAAWEEAKTRKLTVAAIKTISQSQKREKKTRTTSGGAGFEAVPNLHPLVVQTPNTLIIKISDVTVTFQADSSQLQSVLRCNQEFVEEQVRAVIDAISSGAQIASDSTEEAAQSSSTIVPQPAGQANAMEETAAPDTLLPDNLDDPDKALVNTNAGDCDDGSASADEPTAPSLQADVKEESSEGDEEGNASAAFPVENILPTDVEGQSEDQVVALHHVGVKTAQPSEEPDTLHDPLPNSSEEHNETESGDDSASSDVLSRKQAANVVSHDDWLSYEDEPGCSASNIEILPDDED